jgi:alpha-mannosidase
MIYDSDGTPLQGEQDNTAVCTNIHSPIIFLGITGGYGGDRRVEYIIPPQGRKQGRYEFMIESR